jgi:hypothetical protein
MIEGNPVNIDRLAPDMVDVLTALQEQRPEDWRRIVLQYNLGRPHCSIEGFSPSEAASALRRIRNHVTANPDELPTIFSGVDNQ